MNKYKNVIKILHICLSGQYLDGWGYQENLLPHYLQEEGTENIVIASSNYFPSYLSLDTVQEIKSKGLDYEYEGVRIIRIPTKNPTSSLAFAPSLYSVICKISPDVIFHHDVVFSTLNTVRHYVRNHPVTLVVDSHADELNMSHNALWRLFYHKIANKWACNRIQPYVKAFYGVSPGRCEFLQKYYSINPERISLLPIGADVEAAEQISSKEVLRHKYGFDCDEKIVVSGGKMGKDKGTDVLIDAVQKLSYKLVLFGSFSDEATKIKADESSCTRIFGWCDRTQTLELLRLADVACWPVHHTTLIEDSISVETPLLVRETGNTSHLLSGNGMWTHVESLRTDLEAFFSTDIKDYDEATKAKKEEISYSTVAKKILSELL